MIKVKSRGNETVDQMLHRFKKLCEKEGVIKDMKRVSYYEKPSEKRRRRLRKAQEARAQDAAGGRHRLSGASAVELTKRKFNRAPADAALGCVFAGQACAAWGWMFLG